MKLTCYFWFARVPILAYAFFQSVMATFCLIVLEPQSYSVGNLVTVICFWLRLVVHPIEDGGFPLVSSVDNFVAFCCLWSIELVVGEVSAWDLHILHCLP